MYVNFVDYEKAFDSVDRDTLWKLLRHYGIPLKFVDIIRNSYDGMSCRVIHEGEVTDSFEVRTGVRQGCLLSPFLFLLAIDWIMNVVTSQGKNGIQWTLWSQLDDLDFADDLALLSHSHEQMQRKTTSLEETSAQVGLKINEGKTKILKLNSNNTSSVKVGDRDLEEVEEFTYLGSIVDGRGGTDSDVKTRIGKARTAFRQLRNIWNTREISTRTKLRIFRSNVKSVLLYGCETWRMNKTTTRKIQVFINGCLRQILGIHWPETISNADLWRRTGEEDVEREIAGRKWRWIGHTLRKPPDNITKQSLRWNPQGRRGRGRPRSTWRREVEAEMKKIGYNWDQIDRMAQDRQHWRVTVSDLCPCPRDDG